MRLVVNWPEAVEKKVARRILAILILSAVIVMGRLFRVTHVNAAYAASANFVSCETKLSGN